MLFGFYQKQNNKHFESYKKEKGERRLTTKYLSC